MFEVHKAKKAVGAINDEFATKKNAARTSLWNTYNNIPSLGYNEKGLLRVNPATVEAHDAYTDTMSSLDIARRNAVAGATQHLNRQQFGKLRLGNQRTFAGHYHFDNE